MSGFKSYLPWIILALAILSTAWTYKMKQDIARLSNGGGNGGGESTMIP